MEENKNETNNVVEETMDDYKDMIDSSMMKFSTGDVVEGEVIGVTDEEILMNFGYIADGVIPVNETFADAENPLSAQYQVGDKIKAEVIRKDDGDGNVLLSLKKAQQEIIWDQLQEIMEADKQVEATVVEVVKGGLVCKVLQTRGFMPGSMISTSYVQDLNEYSDKTFNVKVMELDREKNRVILSHKEIEKVELAKQQDELFATIKKGDAFKGTVKKNMNYGSFVNIGCVDGLVHINEMSWKNISHPSDVVKEGDVVNVTVVNVDYDKKKIGLSMKNAEDDPWNVSNESLKVGQSYEGKVKRVLDFGAFVEILPGVEGLVHISQISNEHINHPSDVLKEGDTVTVKVLGIDNKERKLRLSMKTDEQETVREEYVDVKEYQTEEQATTSLKNVFADILKDMK
ncbi:30S ribosomal protein S1 [Vallitaleaceae bacterium 9-2]